MAHEELGEFIYRGVPIRFWRNTDPSLVLRGWGFVEGGREYANTFDLRMSGSVSVPLGIGVLEDAIETIDHLFSQDEISDPPDLRGPWTPPPTKDIVFAALQVDDVVFSFFGDSCCWRVVPDSRTATPPETGYMTREIVCISGQREGERQIVTRLAGGDDLFKRVEPAP
jgi:hypothetical protein